MQGISGRLTPWPSGPASPDTYPTPDWDRDVWRETGHHGLEPIVAAGVAATGI